MKTQEWLDQWRREHEACQRAVTKALLLEFVSMIRQKPADATPATPRKTRTRAPRKGRRPRP